MQRLLMLSTIRYATSSPETVTFPPDTAVTFASTDVNPVTSNWYSPAALIVCDVVSPVKFVAVSTYGALNQPPN
jgi:hypothetical protein